MRTTPKHYSSESFIESVLFNRNLLIIFIVTVGILPALIAYGGYYVMGDGVLQELAFIYEAKRMFSSGIPFWSWNSFVGDNYIGAYSYYIFVNVFALINCLFPYKYIGLGFTLMLYAKFLLCGYVTDVYLRKMNFDPRMARFGALLFTFSSWAICNQLYYFFMEPMIMFVVLLICIERFLQGDRFGMTFIAIAVAGVCLTNFAFAPANLLMGALYFFCRATLMSYSFNNTILMLLKAVLAVAIGIALAAALLLPVAYFISGSSRISTGSGLDMLNIGARLLSLFIPTFIEGYIPYGIVHTAWNSNHACIAVMGILPALLYILRSGFNWLSIFFIFCLVLFLSPLNGLFVFFIDYQYSRWCYVLILAIVLATLYYLQDFGPISTRAAVIYSLVCLCLYGVFAGASWYIKLFRTHESWNFEHWQLVAIAALLVLNLLCLIWMAKGQFPERGFTKGFIALTVCVCTQFLFFTWAQTDFSVLTRETNLGVSRYYVDNDLERGDPNQPFTYRTDFRTLRPASMLYPNMPQLKNHPSHMGYNSMKNPHLYKLFDAATEPGTATRNVFVPTANRTSFDALLSVKQVVDFNDPGCVEPVVEGLKLRHHTEGHDIYKFKYYIPMGFTYDKYMLVDEVTPHLKSDSLPDLPLAMLNALAISPEDESELSPYLKKTSLNTDADIDSVVACRRATVCSSFAGDTRGFSATISLDEPKVIFFSVAADPGFSATIDGRGTKIHNVNLGLSAIVVPAGDHYIRFSFVPQGLKNGIYISIAAFICLVLMFVFELRAGGNRRRRYSYSGLRY